MPRMFISHSSKDHPFADDLADLLRLHTLDKWHAGRDIPAFEWEKAICEGLPDCKTNGSVLF